MRLLQDEKDGDCLNFSTVVNRSLATFLTIYGSVSTGQLYLRRYERRRCGENHLGERSGIPGNTRGFDVPEPPYHLCLLATFHLAQRALCAAAIRFRPAADILRLGRLPRELLKPLRTEIALSIVFNCAWSLLRSVSRSRTVLDRSTTLPPVKGSYHSDLAALASIPRRSDK